MYKNNVSVSHVISVQETQCAQHSDNIVQIVTVRWLYGNRLMWMRIYLAQVVNSDSLTLGHQASSSPAVIDAE